MFTPHAPSSGRLLLGTLVLLLAIACDQRSTPSPVAPEPVAPATPAPAPPAPPLPGQLTYSGLVREPGAGPLAGVTVIGGAALSTTTDASGAFVLVGTVKSIISFNKPGYTSTYVVVGALSASNLTSLDVRMQRAYAVSDTSPVDGMIFPDDLEYGDELNNLWWERPYFCGPCRYITVDRTVTGPRVYRLRWTGNIPLDLFGGEYYADGPIIATSAPGASELRLSLPATQSSQIILVGVGQRNGQRQAVSAPIHFTLNVEPPTP